MTPEGGVNLEGVVEPKELQEIRKLLSENGGSNKSLPNLVLEHAEGGILDWTVNSIPSTLNHLRAHDENKLADAAEIYRGLGNI